MTGAPCFRLLPTPQSINYNAGVVIAILPVCKILVNNLTEWYITVHRGLTNTHVLRLIRCDIMLLTTADLSLKEAYYGGSYRCYQHETIFT